MGAVGQKEGKEGGRRNQTGQCQLDCQYRPNRGGIPFMIRNGLGGLSGQAR